MYRRHYLRRFSARVCGTVRRKACRSPLIGSATRRWYGAKSCVPLSSSLAILRTRNYTYDETPLPPSKEWRRCEILVDLQCTSELRSPPRPRSSRPSTRPRWDDSDGASTSNRIEGWQLVTDLHTGKAGHVRQSKVRPQGRACGTSCREREILGYCELSRAPW